MSNFSRYAFGAAAGLVAAVALPLSAAAQDPAPTSLRLSLSSFGGYDTDVTGTAVDADTAPSAPYGGGTMSLRYQTRTDKIAFTSRGSIDYRNYRTDRPVSATSYTGNSAFAVDLTSRLNVSASISSLYSPRFVFSLLPAIGDIATTDSLPIPLDYGVSAQSTATVFGGGSAALRVSRRSTLNVAVSGGTQRLLDDDVDIRTKTYGGGYSYVMTRYAKLRAGYSQLDSDYPAIFAGRARRYSQRSIDAGVDYSRPLSISRRTTFSFGTGTAAIDDGNDTLYKITGTASLHHQMRRTWNANLAYVRGLGIVPGFTEPFFADSVNANVRGNLTNRVALDLTAGYTNGYVGIQARNLDYVSYQANTRLEWAVHRERLGIYGHYYYYAHEFVGTTPMPNAIPRQVDRHGVRAGIIFRFPLLQERMRRVTR